MSRLIVGAMCIVERRGFGGRVDHRWQDRIVKLTPKRAYFLRGEWFALDDPRREVKPKYLDYDTVVTEVRAQ